MNRILLINGFLGAGKTTFINQLVKQYPGETALLINDFGKVNIDAMQLTSDGYQMIELSNGSIFCSCLKENFIDGLAELLQYETDLIIVEGSGLADPSNMGSVLQVLDKISKKEYTYLGAICVIDGVYFQQELKTMESVRRQVENSDIALLNKVDLIDELQRKEIMDQLKAINPDIVVKETIYGKCNQEELLQVFESRKGKASTKETLNTPENRPMTLLIKLERVNTIEELNILLQKVLPYTNRMKGYTKINGKVVKVESVQQSLIIEENSDQDKRETGIIVFLKNGLKSLRDIQKLNEKQLKIEL